MLQTPSAEILTIGDELLNGEIVDTNKPYLAAEMVALGIPCRYFQTVGDEIDDIVDSFRLALSRSKVILTTGGLGPTDDDLTTESLARCLGVELEFREEVMDQMATRLQRPKDQFSGSSRKQALLPKGAVVLQNHWGTAPAMRYDTPEGCHVFLLPGVPREMKALFEAWIKPFILEKVPDRAAIATKLLHCFGIPESQIGDRLKDLMQPGRNPDVGTKVRDGQCSVRIVAKAANPSDAEQLLARDVEWARHTLRDGLFGEDEDTLVGVTVRNLLDQNKTIALAESCTAGLIASLLARVPGVSATLREAAVVYSNEAKVKRCGVKPETLARHGAVSEQTARELAEGIRERAGTDIGFSVTGIAGPDGGSVEKPVGTVCFGIATANGTRTWTCLFPGFARNAVRDRAANVGINWLRVILGEEQRAGDGKGE